MTDTKVHSKVEIEEQLASEVSTILQNEIHKFGDASLLVSGGSTPLGFFEALSIKDIDWSKVNISLVDERFLPDGCSEQNGSTVKKILLSNFAKPAKFFPLILNPINIEDCLDKFKQSISNLRQPFTVVVLGMGKDGHTASFFPDSNEIDELMDPDNTDQVMITHTPSSPFPRLTFTYSALINAKYRFLHFYGEEKFDIYKKALNNESYLPYPIQMFLNNKKRPIKVFSTI